MEPRYGHGCNGSRLREACKLILKIVYVDPMLTGPKGRNTGMKAVFGGAVKKPLMTKVSMRHLNEIVRERNQYSRDAMEAWQDFINLKGRMDMDLSKVTKRNNFLVEELESWKQQVIQFWKDCVTCPDSKHSSSNFKRLLSNSPKRLKISKLRLNRINAKIAASHRSLISRKTILHALRCVFRAPSGNVMMPSRLL